MVGILESRLRGSTAEYPQNSRVPVVLGVSGALVRSRSHDSGLGL